MSSPSLPKRPASWRLDVDEDEIQHAANVIDARMKHRKALPLESFFGEDNLIPLKSLSGKDKKDIKDIKDSADVVSISSSPDEATEMSKESYSKDAFKADIETELVAAGMLPAIESKSAIGDMLGDAPMRPVDEVENKKVDDAIDILSKSLQGFGIDAQKQLAAMLDLPGAIGEPQHFA